MAYGVDTSLLLTDKHETAYSTTRYLLQFKL